MMKRITVIIDDIEDFGELKQVVEDVAASIKNKVVIALEQDNTYDGVVRSDFRQHYIVIEVEDI